MQNLTKEISPKGIFLVKQFLFLFSEFFRIVFKKKQDFFLVKRNCFQSDIINIFDLPNFITFMSLIELNLSCFFVNRDHD